METINPVIKTFSTWKRVAIISFLGGLGVAVVLCALLASILWYSNRPKQWNAQAIRAHYRESGCYAALEDWYKKEGAFPNSPSKLASIRLRTEWSSGCS